MITIGSLFSGIGGLELGLERAGLGHTIWQAEIDPFCRSVLAHHWPDAVRYESVEAVDARAERPTILAGGFPCQDVSGAGNRQGLSGSRSGLWFEYLRIIRLLRPPIVVVENVPGLLIRGFDEVLGGLAAERYDAEWRMYGASDVGAPHLRRRIFIVATQGSLSDAERDGLRLQWQRHRQQHHLARATLASEHGQELADGRGERSQGLDGAGPAPRAVERSDPHVADAARSGRQGSPEREEHRGQPGPVAAELGGDHLADGDGRRREGFGLTGQARLRGQRSERGNEPDRRDLPQWPPAPDDVHAWGGVPAEAQPSVCKLADGLSAGLDWIVGGARRQALEAFGNAVVPAVAEHVGLELVVPALERLIGAP
jgi:site-specific DNA-cytosine methylase